MTLLPQNPAGQAWLAVLLVFTLAGFVLLARAWIEPLLLETTHIRLRHGPDMPIRVLLLSDLHAEHMRLSAEAILAACQATSPDLVLFAGDLSAKPCGLPAALDLFRRLRGMPVMKGCRFLAVRGNHDRAENLAGLQEAGVDVLVNRPAVVTIRGKDWAVVGLDDLRTGRPDIPAALAGLADIPPGRRIVLAHNPDALFDWPAGEAALFLSGHLHGGQVWMPFKLEFLVLRSDKMPKIGHIKGLFDWKGMPAYISRGLGCVALPLRLFSKPEITLFEIS
jgi:uncharacterized protein